MPTGENLMEGMDSLFEKLDNIADIEQDIIRILDKCGKFVADDARYRVPVDNGDLKKSIQHSVYKTDDGAETSIHTNSDHAAFVEFGTGPVGALNHNGTSPNVTPVYKQEKWLARIPGLVSEHDSGLRYIAGQKAQPYLYPALKDNEEQLEKYMVSEIRKVIGRNKGG